MERVILHCDMNSFYANVELLDYPELLDVPVAVCGNPSSRHGIVLAKNQPAKNFGIKTAETIWQAKKKCPNLVLLSPHHEKYTAYYRIINGIYGRFTDMVEPFSIDESWLDVTASQTLFGAGKQIADTIRQTVKEETGLTLSAGVSFNKIFAKMGSEYRKPDATTEITPSNYKDILWPMAIEEMFMVGKATAAKLKQNNFHTIGQVALAKKETIVALLGFHGSDLWDNVNGKNNSPVSFQSQKRQLQSIGHGMTFPKDLSDPKDICTAALALSDKATARLRRHHLKAGGVKIDIKDPNFHLLSRQAQLPTATDVRQDIYNLALQLLSEALGYAIGGTSAPKLSGSGGKKSKTWKKGAPIRLLTITCINLTDAAQGEQLSLFDASFNKQNEKLSNLNDAMDEIRDKFGSGAITYGRIVNNDIGLDTKTYAESHKKDDPEK